MHLVAVLAVGQRTLEADVRGLDPRARVGAAVDVDGERLVERRQPVLELADQVRRPRLGLDDRELAELDPGARHRAAAERARVPDVQPGGLQAVDQGVDPVGCDVEDDELLLDRQPDAVGAGRLDEVGDRPQQLPGDASDGGCDADVEAAVLLRVHADVVAAAGRRWRRGGAVGQRPAQVLALQHLPEQLGTPVGDQELQPGAGPQPAVAVVAEDADDAGPHLGHLVERDERAEPLAELRVGRQRAADPHVEAGAELGVHDADERDVVDLVRDVVVRGAADRGLELARQVGERGVADVPLARSARIAGVPSMISSAATPATGEPRMTRGVSPQASCVVRPTASSRRQISGTSSMRIQCSWMFCRSVMSAVPRPNSTETCGDHAQLLAGSGRRRRSGRGA